MASTTTVAAAPPPSKELSKSTQEALRRYQLTQDFSGAALAAWLQFLRRVDTSRQRRGDHEQERQQARDFLSHAQPILDELADWKTADTAKIFAVLEARWDSMVRLTKFGLTAEDVLELLKNSRKSSKDPGDAAAACIAVTPPDDVRVIRRLAQTGFQKRVFEARWTASGQPQKIVLKEFLRDADILVGREMQAYPLSMMHPNIIQTYRLENPADPARPFLAERLIHPLNDEWEARGLVNAAAVLTDISRALAFLADQGLVHGDIKPDNIGYDNSRYLLLDFGVARAATVFAKRDEPSGTIRTRAPEVIQGLSPQTSASDVYALGASVFNTLFQRFPLIGSDDDIGNPNTAKRTAFLKELKRRIDQDGFCGELKLLDGCQHEGFRELLRSILDPDPTRRPDAADVVVRAIQTLEGLVGSTEGPLFNAWDELDQMRRYLSSSDDDMKLIPKAKAIDLGDRLDVLQRSLEVPAIEQLVDDLLAQTQELHRAALDVNTRAVFKATLTALEEKKAGSSKLDEMYPELVQQIKGRLDQREDEWPPVTPDATSALTAPLNEKFNAETTASYRAQLRTLVSALERRHSLPAW